MALHDAISSRLHLAISSVVHLATGGNLRHARASPPPRHPVLSAPQKCTHTGAPCFCSCCDWLALRISASEAEGAGPAEANARVFPVLSQVVRHRFASGLVTAADLLFA